MNQSVRLIIVPSAWLGPWAYQTLQSALRQLDLDVCIADLPGRDRSWDGNATGASHASPKSPTLEDYVKAVVVAASGAECVVLVGHSFGGVIASQAAETLNDKVAGLIFVAGFAPTNGESFMSLASEIQSKALESLEMTPDGQEVWVSPTQAHLFLAGDVPLSAFQQVAPKFTREWVPPMHETVVLSEAKWGNIARFYIRTELDRALPLEAQDRMIQHVGVEGTETLKSSHVPNFSMPDELASAVRKLAAEAVRMFAERI